MSQLAPICLFTYNRVDETIQTINALKNNYLAKWSDLIIFSDGPKNKQAIKNVFELRKFLKTVTGFKSVIIHESSENKGLANSIITGVNQTVNEYGKVIVVEDDLITMPNFLDFMNQALDFYATIKKIQSINGFSLKIECKADIYFHNRTFPWGWGTWKDRWSKNIFDIDEIEKTIKLNNALLDEFNKKCGNDMTRMLKDSLSGAINSWYIRWAFNHFINNTYAVFPNTSKIINIGFDIEATHCKGINTYVSDLDEGEKRIFVFFDFKKLPKETDEQILRYFKRSYKLLFRLKLFRTKIGRGQLWNEIVNRIFKN